MYKLVPDRLENWYMVGTGRVAAALSLASRSYSFWLFRWVELARVYSIVNLTQPQEDIDSHF